MTPPDLAIVDHLAWTVRPKLNTGHKRESFTTDFRFMRDGFSPSARSHKSGRGRPGLASRLLPGLHVLLDGATPDHCKSLRGHLRSFWSFLDHLEALTPYLDLPASDVAIDDLDWHEIERIWPHWIDWLKARDTDPFYPCNIVKRIVDAAFASVQPSPVAPLFLVQPFPVLPADTLDKFYREEDAKRLCVAFTVEWRHALKRIAEGNRLADQGRDPRTGKGWVGPCLWDDPANRLYLVKHVLGIHAVPYGDIQRQASGLDKREGCPALPLRATFASRGTAHALHKNGHGAHVRWLLPTAEDLTYAFNIVALRTGWNDSTIADLRRDDWCMDHPRHPDRASVIYSAKGRSGGRDQTAYSLKSRATHAHGIIRKVIELTEPLAKRVSGVMARRQQELSVLEEGGADPDRTRRLRSEIDHLKHLCNRVWLYSGSTQLGFDVGVKFLGDTKTARNHLRDSIYGAETAAVIAKHDIRDAEGDLLKWSVAMARDAWALFAYETSGFNVLMAQLALGHQGLDTLLDYLERRSIRIQNRKRMIDLQQHIITEIRDGRCDPRILRALVDHGTLAEEQRRRITDPAYRTNKGVQCIDPLNPDPEADPKHRPGQRCGTQDCFSCSRMYASVESLPHLMRIILDLRDIQSEVALAMWETSDFPMWLAVAEHIVGKFAPALRAEAEIQASDLPRQVHLFTSNRRAAS